MDENPADTFAESPGAPTALAESGAAAPEFLDWHEMDTVHGLDGSRPYAPLEEFERRRRAFSRMARVLIVGFCLPVLGVSESWLTFPQFELMGMGGRMALIALLPLVVGVAVWIGSCFDGRVRGLTALAGGLALFVVAFGFDGIGALVQAPWQAGGSPLQHSVSLLVMAVLGLFVAARVRRYRPLLRSAYAVAWVAAACWVGFLLLPIGGAPPIVEPFRAFQQSALLGVAVSAHMLFVAAAMVLALRNPPSQPAFNAARRASVVSRLLVLSVLVPIAVFASVMVVPLGRGGAAVVLPVLSLAAKAIMTLGGLLMLVPVACADLWIGRSDALGS